MSRMLQRSESLFTIYVAEPYILKLVRLVKYAKAEMNYLEADAQQDKTFT